MFMFYRLLLIVIIALMFTAVPGCKKSPDTDVPDQRQREQDTEITKENLDSELDKMEREINSETDRQD